MAVPAVKPRALMGWRHVKDAVLADPIPTVGARIAALRTACRWSQDELAAKLGVTGKAVSYWEQGRNEPQAVYLYRLAQLWNCSMDQLYSGGATWTPPVVFSRPSPARQCSGQTGAGNRCRMRTTKPSGRCGFHPEAAE